MSSDSESFVNVFLRGLSEIFLPMESIDLPQRAIALLRDLGWEPPGGELVDQLEPVRKLVRDLRVTVYKIDDAGSETEHLELIRSLFGEIKSLVDSIKEFTSRLGSLPSTFDGFIADSSFVDDFSGRLMDYLLVSYLQVSKPRLYAALIILGLIDSKNNDPGIDPHEPSTYIYREIRWDRFPQVFSDPSGLAEGVYKWKTDFNTSLFLSRIELILRAFALPGGLYLQDPNVSGNLDPANTEELRIPAYHGGRWPHSYSEGGITISPIITDPKGFAVIPYLLGASEIVLDVGSRWTFALSTSASLDSGIGIIIRSGQEVDFKTSLFSTHDGPGEFHLTSKIASKPLNGDQIFIFGSPNATRLSIKEYSLGVTAQKSSSTSDLAIELDISGLNLVVRASEGDGFLQKLLPQDGIDASFDVGIGLSTSHGLFFKGSSVLEVTIPVHKTLGPITIESVYIVIGVDGGITLTLTTTVGAQIGPISASVERIGIEIPASFHSDNSGNLGPVNIDGTKFVPPLGAGLVINTEAVAGGGYLRFDAPNERYDGILYLSFGEIALTAIGLITTRLPDGSKGFSMLAIIGVEFDPAYALGWGFFLKGVGGLIGIHRTMDLDAIQDGIRTGAIDSILFPSDPIANAPKIISDLRSIFPPEEGRYVIGPMVIITWGVPTIISAEIAILIEIPSPIRLAILGQLMAILPDKDEDLVQLRLDVAGLIDFGKGTLSIDATLYDSHLLSYPLEGNMALRSGSGYFAMAVGGLHPAYRPPPGFPSLRRLSVSIGKGGNPRLNLSSYFALTENTIQFGSRFELYAKMSKFNVYGVLGFDTIFYFSPFRFTADIYASVDLRVGSRSLMSVKLDFTLQGPTPWRARGQAKFKILWVKYKKNFDKTFGRSADTVLPALNPWPEFMASLEEPNNWVAVFPTGRQPPVAIQDIQLLTDADVDASGGATPPPIVIDPVGELVFKQKVVPLGVQITRFGNGRPEEPVTFNVSVSSDEAPDLTVVDVKDQFPPGQFWNRSESELLSVRGELHKSGLRMSGATASYVDPVAMDVKFEEKQFPEIPGQGSKVVNLDRSIGLISSAISSAAKMEQVLARLSGFGLPTFDPHVQVMEPGFVIVTTVDLTPVEGLIPDSTPVTWIEAQTRMNEHVGLNPEVLNLIQVVPQEEAIMP